MYLCKEIINQGFSKINYKHLVLNCMRKSTSLNQLFLIINTENVDIHTFLLIMQSKYIPSKLNQMIDVQY